MLISKEKKFVFIHIPKTAGDSITEALREYCNVVDTNKYKHLHPRQIRNKYFGDGTWNQFFKFAFVRNPWDRFHSDYYFCRYYFEHRQDQITNRGWFLKCQAASKETFEQFLTRENTLFPNYYSRYG